MQKINNENENKLKLFLEEKELYFSEMNNMKEKYKSLENEKKNLEIDIKNYKKIYEKFQKDCYSKMEENEEKFIKNIKNLEFESVKLNLEINKLKVF